MPYITAGYPRRDDTVDLLLAAQQTGCPAVEIGIPFSDPLADGPTIQRAGWRALGNGMTTSLALEQAATARSAGVQLALAVMTYVNPVLSHGVDRFCAEAAAAGLDGLIIPDLPADEADAVRSAAERHDLGLVPMVAPTTGDERMRRTCDSASGFVYCVSVTGTTGARRSIGDEAFDLLQRVRACTTLPRAIGFGLSSHEHVEALRGRCEAAVVGSAFLDALDDGSHQSTAANAAAFLMGMLGDG